MFELAAIYTFSHRGLCIGLWSWLSSHTLYSIAWPDIVWDSFVCNRNFQFEMLLNLINWFFFPPDMWQKWFQFWMALSANHSVFTLRHRCRARVSGISLRLLLFLWLRRETNEFENVASVDSACGARASSALVHSAVSLKVLPTTLADQLRGMSQSPIQTK